MVKSAKSVEKMFSRTLGEFIYTGSVLNLTWEGRNTFKVVKKIKPVLKQPEEVRGSLLALPPSVVYLLSIELSSICIQVSETVSTCEVPTAVVESLVCLFFTVNAN